MASPEPTQPNERRPSRWPSAIRRWWGRRGSKPSASVATVVPSARFRNLCISREAGSGSATIARAVGARLGWRVLDDELIDAIAGRMELPLEEVRAFDELAPSVVQDWILPLREEHYAPQEAYLDHLAKLVEEVGSAGDAILLGRGAGFLLPRDRTLSIRIVAPLRIRAVRLAERLGVSPRTARRAAIDLDRRRSHFVRTMYRVDAHDPHNYDLVLDSHALGVPIAVEIIVRAIEAGGMPRLVAAVD